MSRPLYSFNAKLPNALAIYTQLKELITSFEMLPGQRLTESELALKFNVSRTPIREAIKRLETEGFIDVHPKRGCYVRALDISELSEYYEVRIALEQLAIEAACNNMPDKVLQQIMAAWHPDKHDEDMAAGIDLGQKDEAFHVSLAENSDKPVLADMIRDINNRIRIIRRLDINSDKRSIRTYNEHYEILNYVLQRDLTKAKQAIKRHIIRSRDFAKTLTLTALAQKKVKQATQPPTSS
ncbi:MAG TPA: GntR family transcriptional regulator [Methylophilaceae bacterium]